MQVVVSYAAPSYQIEIPLEVEKNCTVALAILRSGLLDKFTEIKLSEVQVGIYSKKVVLDHLLQPGDRVEIYRPLIIDPKQARILRAKKKKTI